MRKIYINSEGKQVARPKSLVVGTNTYVPPTDEQLVAVGYEIREIIDPIPEPYPKEQQYKWRVSELIRQEYSIDDELALHRQRDTKVQEFAAYNTYCESCKQQAYQEIYGEESV